LEDNNDILASPGQVLTDIYHDHPHLFPNKENISYKNASGRQVHDFKNLYFSYDGRYMSAEA
jgi:hypothetical protein